MNARFRLSNSEKAREWECNTFNVIEQRLGKEFRSVILSRIIVKENKLFSVLFCFVFAFVLLLLLSWNIVLVSDRRVSQRRLSIFAVVYISGRSSCSRPVFGQ